MGRRYLELDVFATTPLSGNPLAVVVDGAGLDEAAMQRFANWTNLSETNFLLPPSDPGRRLPRPHLHPAGAVSVRRAPDAG